MSWLGIGGVEGGGSEGLIGEMGKHVQEGEEAERMSLAQPEFSVKPMASFCSFFQRLLLLPWWSEKKAFHREGGGVEVGFPAFLVGSRWACQHLPGSRGPSW